MYVSMSVCSLYCNTITLESLDVESLFLVLMYIYRVYGSSSYMKVIGSRSRSKEAQNFIPECKTSIGSDSGSVEDRAVKFACSMGFLDMADRPV